MRFTKLFNICAHIATYFSLVQVVQCEHSIIASTIHLSRGHNLHALSSSLHLYHASNTVQYQWYCTSHNTWLCSVATRMISHELAFTQICTGNCISVCTTCSMKILQCTLYRLQSHIKLADHWQRGTSNQDTLSVFTFKSKQLFWNKHHWLNIIQFSSQANHVVHPCKILHYVYVILHFCSWPACLFIECIWLLLISEEIINEYTVLYLSRRRCYWHTALCSLQNNVFARVHIAFKYFT